VLEVRQAVEVSYAKLNFFATVQGTRLTKV